MGAGAVAPAVRPRAVRLKAARVTLQATQVQQSTERVILPNGDAGYVANGSWIISHQGQVVDTCGETIFQQKYEPADEAPGLRIPDEHRSRLERALGFGSTDTPDHLTTAVERLARLHVGDVQIDFTPGQWEEIRHRAGKMGLTPKQLCERLASKILADFWTT